VLCTVYTLTKTSTNEKLWCVLFMKLAGRFDEQSDLWFWLIYRAFRFSKPKPDPFKGNCLTFYLSINSINFQNSPTQAYERDLLNLYSARISRMTFPPGEICGECNMRGNSLISALTES